MTVAGSDINLFLSEMAERYAICRLDPTTDIPVWASQGSFYSITHTVDELSVVCRQQNVPPGITCERDWRCLKVEGPLSFTLTGILASIAAPLAEAGISIFAIGTYDTDYILLKEEQYGAALRVLTQNGHEIRRCAIKQQSND